MIRKAQANLKKCPKERRTVGYIQAKLDCSYEYWTTFKTRHQELVTITQPDKRKQIPYFANEDFYAVEDVYLCLQADLKDMLKSESKTDMGPTQSSSGTDLNVTVSTPPQVQLPRIQIPIFKGDYEDWPTFQDLFTTLVHECASLSRVQKLHYLKTSVAGEAEALLKNIKVLESNYEQAWTMLKDRYGNKRLIVRCLLKRLFTQKSLSSQSATRSKRC